LKSFAGSCLARSHDVNATASSKVRPFRQACESLGVNVMKEDRSGSAKGDEDDTLHCNILIYAFKLRPLLYGVAACLWIAKLWVWHRYTEQMLAKMKLVQQGSVPG
jgi:hypothetical protein